MNKKLLIGSIAALTLVAGASAKLKIPKVKTTVAKTAVKPTTPVATTQPVLAASLLWGQTATLTAPAAAPAPAPAPAVVAQSRPALAALPPLDLTSMRLWNWGAKWIGAEWSNGMSPLPWKFDHIQQPAGADTLLTLDAAGSAQLQGGGATAANSDGLWETEVTLPQLRHGMIVAPLWLYDQTSRDEIDFELAGRNGLDVSMHVYVNGVHKQNTVRLFRGVDLSGKRMRFGIKLDQRSGFAEMYVDGARVHRWDRGTTGFFVSKPMKPWIELWAADPGNSGFVSWVGKWTGLANNEKLTMRVHGYAYTTPAGQMVR